MTDGGSFASGDGYFMSGDDWLISDAGEWTSPYHPLASLCCGALLHPVKFDHHTPLGAHTTRIHQ